MGGGGVRKKMSDSSEKKSEGWDCELVIKKP